jgi:ABC-type Fe3+-hydroxamate transport system substrate-binding protein
VSYYITAKAKGKTADWQRARALALFDEANAPVYDSDYYLEKLDDWLERYGRFVGENPRGDGQVNCSDRIAAERSERRQLTLSANGARH